MLTVTEAAWKAGQAEDPSNDMHELEFCADTRAGEIESNDNAAFFMVKGLLRDVRVLVLATGWPRAPICRVGKDIVMLVLLSTSNSRSSCITGLIPCSLSVEDGFLWSHAIQFWALFDAGV